MLNSNTLVLTLHGDVTFSTPAQQVVSMHAFDYAYG